METRQSRLSRAVHGMLLRLSMPNVAEHADIALSWPKQHSPLLLRFLTFNSCELCTTSTQPSIGVGNTVCCGKWRGAPAAVLVVKIAALSIPKESPGVVQGKHAEKSIHYGRYNFSIIYAELFTITHTVRDLFSRALTSVLSRSSDWCIFGQGRSPWATRRKTWILRRRRP